MFTALRENGVPVYLRPRRTKQELMKEKEIGKFYCPECKEELLLKIGQYKVEHFAHQKGASCMEHYERESEYHLQGKLHLMDWLEKQHLQPKLEPYYDVIRQRPDIGVTYEKNKYAIEYQCSTIPPELLIKRTKKYQSNKYIPIWIMGGKNIKRKGVNKISLSNFDYLFLSKSNSGNWYLPSYCSSTQQFILLTNIIPTSTRNAIAHITTIPFHQLTFSKLVQPDKQRMYSIEIWRKEIQKQKTSLLFQGFQQPFLQELYTSSLNISLLPPYIGIPVLHAPLIETAPLIWQTYIFMDLLRLRKEKSFITLSDVYRSFIKREKKKQITFRLLPLTNNLSSAAPVNEYLQQLVKFQILDKTNENTFRWKNKLNTPIHVMEQIEMENKFYKQYGHSLFQ